MRGSHHRLAWLFATLLGACGTQGAHDGGGANLPNRGIVPYDAPPRMDAGTDDAGVDAGEPEPPEPPVIAGPDDAAERGYTAPSALVIDGAVRLWAERLGDAPAVVHIPLGPDGLASVGPPEVVLEGVGRPSVIRDGDGFLLAGTRDGAIVFARSADGGTFAIVDAPPVAPEAPYERGGIGEPSLVAHADGFVLFYGARRTEDGPVLLVMTRGGADLRFAGRTVVLQPGGGCVDTFGVAGPCWDGAGVDQPEVRLARTASGRAIWRLFYSGQRPDGDAALGFAGGFTPDAFQRYPFNPIVAPRGEDALHPSNVRLADRYLLYSARGTFRASIQVRVNDGGAASEQF